MRRRHAIGRRGPVDGSRCESPRRSVGQIGVRLLRPQLRRPGGRRPGGRRAPNRLTCDMASPVAGPRRAVHPPGAPKAVAECRRLPQSVPGTRRAGLGEAVSWDRRRTWCELSFVAGKNLAIFGQQREHRPKRTARGENMWVRSPVSAAPTRRFRSVGHDSVSDAS